jgi:hypothetical protein
MTERLNTMTTTAAEAVYVRCDQYCGMKITNTGDAGAAQHASDCGATPDDLTQLDNELAAKRIQSAAAAETVEDDDDTSSVENSVDDTPAPSFRCSCGSTYATWEDLGGHQVFANHNGMWVEPTDAIEDDALNEREDTVDGSKATINHSRGNKGPKAGEKVDYSHLWRDPEIDSEMVYALQAKINDGTLTIGGIAAGKACVGKATFRDPSDGSNVEVVCPNKCFARTVRKNECDLEHTHSETLEQVCLLHSITSWGAGRPLMDAGPLFGESA